MRTLPMNSSRNGLKRRFPRFSATAGSRFSMVASGEWCSVKCRTRVASLIWKLGNLSGLKYK